VNLFNNAFVRNNDLDATRIQYTILHSTTGPLSDV